MEKINELINNKEFALAKQELLKILDKDEKNIEALKLLGLCHVNLGEFKEGQGVLKLLLNITMMQQAGFILQIAMIIKTISFMQSQLMKKF